MYGYGFYVWVCRSINVLMCGRMTVWTYGCIDAQMHGSFSCVQHNHVATPIPNVLRSNLNLRFMVGVPPRYSCVGTQIQASVLINSSLRAP